MARPVKIGLDYFELDCHMDDKVKLIQAEFGLKGFAVVVKLLQKIYGESGYYCEWNEDVLLLFMSENGLNSDSKNLINEIVAACVRRNFFSEKLFNKFNILTSEGVQKRYLNATSKREKIELKKEYLVISVGKNKDNVVINSIYDGRNSINYVGNTQSREEKSRKENKNSYVHSGGMHETDSEPLEQFYESIWKLYPLKRGKGKVSKTKKQVLQRIGYEQIKRCIERYVGEIKASGKEKYMMNGSTFFNSGYVDYLDENCVDREQPVMPVKENEPEDRFSCLEPDIRSVLESCGAIDGQSLDLGNATDEQIKYLQECGVL